MNDEIQNLLNQAIELNKSGVDHEDKGDRFKAAEAFDQSVAITQGLVAQEPGEMAFQRELATSLFNRGRIYNQSGYLTKAYEALKESLKVHQWVTSREPSRANLEAIRDNLRWLGWTCLAMDRYEEGSEAFEEAVKASTHLLKSQSAEPQLYLELKSDLSDLADAYGQSSQDDKRLPIYDQIAQLYSDAIQKWPGELVLQLNYADALLLLAEDRRCAGERELAMGYFLQALEVYQQLLPAHPTDIDILAKIGVCLDFVGLSYRSMGKKKEAIQTHRDAVEIARTVQGLRVNEAGALTRLGKSLSVLAESLSIDKNYEEAIAVGNESVEVNRRAAEMAPKDVTILYDLSMELSHLGTIYKSMGQRRKAVELFDQARSVAKKMRDVDPKNTKVMVPMMASTSLSVITQIQRGRLRKAWRTSRETYKDFKKGIKKMKADADQAKKEESGE